MAWLIVLQSAEVACVGRSTNERSQCILYIVVVGNNGIGQPADLRAWRDEPLSIEWSVIFRCIFLHVYSKCLPTFP